MSVEDRIDCARVGASMEAYLADRMSAGERRSLRLHIQGCPQCFERAVGRDPLHLFAPLADQSPAVGRPGFWDDFWPGIQASIEGGEAAPVAEMESRRQAPALLLRAAAVVMAAAGLAALALLGSPPADRPDVAPVAEAPRADPPGAAGTMPLPPTVERVLSPDSRDVQVYSMTYHQPRADAAEGWEQTELILIVDAELEL